MIIQCHGAFKTLGDSFVIKVQDANIRSVRIAVEKYLCAINHGNLVAILNRSVFASDLKLLKDVDRFNSRTLSLLPPISGG